MTKSVFLFLTLSFLLMADCVASVQVVGSLARTSSVKPGETFQGVIRLKNTGSTRAEVEVRQTDYHFAADGTNIYGEPGSSPRSNANWISVTPPRIWVEPNRTAEVHYKCTVPRQTNLRGAYWSMIMVEPVNSPVPSSGGNDNSLGIQVRTRFGIQILTEIGQGTQAIKVLEKKIVSDESGTPQLQLDIANTGERALHPAISVELYNDKGVSVGRFDAGKKRLYPSCSIRALATLTGISPGKYTALVLLDSGDANVLGAQYSLQVGATE